MSGFSELEDVLHAFGGHAVDISVAGAEALLPSLRSSLRLCGRMYSPDELRSARVAVVDGGRWVHWGNIRHTLAAPTGLCGRLAAPTLTRHVEFSDAGGEVLVEKLWPGAADILLADPVAARWLFELVSASLRHPVVMRDRYDDARPVHTIRGWVKQYERDPCGTEILARRTLTFRGGVRNAQLVDSAVATLGVLAADCCSITVRGGAV